MRNKQAKRAAMLGEAHCWADGPEEIRQRPAKPWWHGLHSVGSTCMLPDGHEGAHEWTPDEQIVIQFAGEEEERGN